MSSYSHKAIIGFYVAMIIISVSFLGLGIEALTDKYEYPVYISEKFTISISPSIYEAGYVINGKISNRTSDDVYISSLTVYCSAGTKNNTRYTATWTKTGILVPANSEITIHETNLSIIGKGDNAYYSSVTSVRCLINSKECTLKYSDDGKSFTNTKGIVIGFVIGGIVGIATIVLLILRVKKSKS